MHVKLIDDELHLEGYVVAILAQDKVPATVMDRFRDAVEGLGAEGATDPEPINKQLAEKATNGLLRLQDAQGVVTKHLTEE